MMSHYSFPTAAAIANGFSQSTPERSTHADQLL
jgi:hypothetical protein